MRFELLIGALQRSVIQTGLVASMAGSDFAE
jgi:hypothetical protein